MADPPAKKARLQPPSVEELNEFSQVEQLYNSNIFRLQIDELLQKVRVKQKQTHTMQKAVVKLREILLALPSMEHTELSDQSWLRAVKVPMVQEPKNTKGVFRFLAPSAVEEVGGYSLGLSAKPQVHVDLLAVIPEACFQEKDYLNQRYLRKRALYLACIAKHLSSEVLVASLQFSYLHGNHYRPILLITLKSDDKHNVVARLHVAPEEGTFNLSRFSPSKNNVRSQWFDGAKCSKGDNSDGTGQTATPFYNSSVLGDLTMLETHRKLTDTLQDAPEFTKAVLLLKVWLRQRQLDQGHGGFSGFIMTMFMVFLLSERKLNKKMSSYQLIRNTFLHLSNSVLTESGCSLAETAPVSMAEFRQQGEPVLVDWSGYNNLCLGMTSHLLHRVVQEAKLAMTLLDNADIDSFQALFLTTMSAVTTFDHLVHVKSRDALGKLSKRSGLAERRLDHGGHVVSTCLPRLLSLLSSALDQRVLLLQPVLPPDPVWSVKDNPPSLAAEEQLTFGLLLDSKHASEVVTRGPLANSPEAGEFQKFWGRMAHQLRTPTGEIHEAVFWTDAVTHRKRRLVCSKIIAHILQRHAEIPPEHVHYVGGETEALLHLSQAEHPEEGGVRYGAGEEQLAEAVQTWQSVSRLLTLLRDLSLSIHDVQVTAPSLRFTEVFPPTTLQPTTKTGLEGRLRVPLPDQPCPPWTPSLQVVCWLEGSGQWPDDLEAIRRLKAAFHHELAECLTKTHGLTVREAVDHLDVLKNGYVFRLRLATSRELAVLKWTNEEKGPRRSLESEESRLLEQQLVGLPKISSYVLGVHYQHGAFSAACRLAKRWLAAHLLLEELPEVAVELLVAQLFLNPAPFSHPSSPQVGFVRFLKLMSTFDWHLSPLVVNFNSELKAEEIAEIQTRFSRDRATLPLMFIATPDDRHTSQWTRHQPSAAVLNRCRLLASKSLSALESQFLTAQPRSDIRLVFRPDLSIFDLVLRLHSRHVARRHQAVDVADAAKPVLVAPALAPSKIFPVTDFDPPHILVQQLQAAYGDVALFLYDRFGGDTIGMLWKPRAAGKFDFKVSTLAGKRPHAWDSQGRVQLQVNTEALVEDIRVLGGGLVASVEARTEKWKF